MSQATRPNDRHIIWSNQNLDVDDWREDYKEFLEANELDGDPNDEQALYEWMEETNYVYLSDERVNLNVQLSQPIIVIGDIGRWNGRVMGYKDIPWKPHRFQWYEPGNRASGTPKKCGGAHPLRRQYAACTRRGRRENLRDGFGGDGVQTARIVQ